MIWLIPNPNEVTTPKRVPTTEMMSTTCPIHPSTRRRPMRGSRTQRMDSGRPRRKVM